MSRLMWGMLSKSATPNEENLNSVVVDGALITLLFTSELDAPMFALILAKVIVAAGELNATCAKV